MNTEAAADAVWDAMGQARYMPSEWAGRAVQLAVLRRHVAAGGRPASTGLLEPLDAGVQ